MKNESNTISVIVPIYNCDKYLEKCIKSIINQTYNELEIILVDDGSTDSSGSICDKYVNLDSRVRCIHKKNGGVSSARNKGLDNVKGNIITFVDSDDYLEPNMYELLLDNMKKNDSDISVCNFYYDFGSKRQKKPDIDVKRDDFFATGKEKFINTQNEFGSLSVYLWNKLYRKEIFNGIRFPEGKIYEDSYVQCDILDRAKKVSYTMKPLYNYVYRKSSIVHDFNLNHFNKIDSYNKQIDFFNKKKYYDLAYEEKNRKSYILVINLAKMVQYHNKNKEVFKKYYKELVDTSKDIKYKDSHNVLKNIRYLEKVIYILEHLNIEYGILLRK